MSNWSANPTGRSVCVVIPSMNRRDDLRRCLSGVFAQRHEGLLEAVVVDNGSTDGTAGMLAEAFPQVRVIRFEENRGPSVARNFAIASTTAQAIWFLDSDSVVEDPGRLAAMLDRLDADPTIGCLGGELTRDAEGREWMRVKSILADGDTGTVSVPLDEVTMRDCGYLATCNSLMRRAVLEEIGGFDPGYFLGSEDKDVGYRVAARGYRNVSDRDAAVWHNVSMATRRSLMVKCRNSLRFSIKNLPVWRVLLLPILTLGVRLRGGVAGRLKAGEPAVTKYATGRAPWIVKLVRLGARYVGAMVAAYAWNLWHLPATLRERVRPRNHIDDAASTLRNGQPTA